MSSLSASSCCVILPVKDSAEVLAECLESLAAALIGGSRAIIVDDGSDFPLEDDPDLSDFLADERFVFLRHETSRGPGAARDTGIAWARRHGAELAILLDCDCLVSPDFIREHLALNERHPEAPCCGGSIRGRGRGLWAALDGAMSWFTSMSETPEGPVRPPYHIPTTNMSLKLSLFRRSDIFDHHLRTGEDVVLIQRLRQREQAIIFSPAPMIYHRDRETLRAFLRHQYRWGLHTYVVRRGVDRLDWGSRLGFAAMFLALSPFYVLHTTALNLHPLLRRSWLYLGLAPALALVYAIKSIAVLDGTLAPRKALFHDPAH